MAQDPINRSIAQARQRIETRKRPEMYTPSPKRLYTNCLGITIDEVRAAVSYDPGTGILSWRRRRGGAKPGTPIATSSFVLHGRARNTFGVIYMIMLGWRPSLNRMHFRDGDGRNWRWDNIRPLEGHERVPPEPLLHMRAPDRTDPACVKRNARLLKTELQRQQDRA